MNFNSFICLKTKMQWGVFKMGTMIKTNKNKKKLNKPGADQSPASHFLQCLWAEKQSDR